MKSSKAKKGEWLLRYNGSSKKRTWAEGVCSKKDNLGTMAPLQSWDSDSLRENVVLAPRMAERFPGLPGSEAVHSHWAAANRPGACNAAMAGGKVLSQSQGTCVRTSSVCTLRSPGRQSLGPGWGCEVASNCAARVRWNPKAQQSEWRRGAPSSCSVPLNSLN